MIADEIFAIISVDALRILLIFFCASCCYRLKPFIAIGLIMSSILGGLVGLNNPIDVVLWRADILRSRSYRSLWSRKISIQKKMLLTTRCIGRCRIKEKTQLPPPRGGGGGTGTFNRGGPPGP